MPAAPVEYKAAVNSLTNYERTQWARAGYPGQRQHEPEKVLGFKGCRDKKRPT